MLVTVEGLDRQRLASGKLLTNQRQLRLRQAEHHVDRLHLGNHHQASGVAGTDLVADIHLTQAQTPTDGRANLAELQVEFGLVDAGLVGFQGATVLVDQGLLGVQGLPGNGVLGQQVLVALQVNLGIAQLRLVLLQGAFGFVQGGAVTAWINHCQ